MTLKLRRVVTGHDQQGKATVLIDEIASNITQMRPGAEACVVWATDGFPISNDGDEDLSKRKVSTSQDNGTVFRVVSFGPGVAPRNHRTNSLDYAVVISGEIDMVLDATTVHLRTGDILVQRGTVHNWINNSTVPCVIAFALIGAKPVTINGKALDGHG